MSTMPRTEQMMTCGGCGASIYQEHLDRRLAGHWEGWLLCPLCLAERKAPAAAAEPDPAEIPLVLEPASGTEQPQRQAPVPATSGFSLADAVRAEKPRERALNAPGEGATRIRIFHSKLSDGAIHHLDDQVNDWLDAHPDVAIKFATSTVGVWEGKHAEPNLILTIFY